MPAPLEFAFLRLRDGLYAFGEGPFEEVGADTRGGYFVLSEFDPFLEPLCLQPTSFQILPAAALRKKFRRMEPDSMWKGQWQCASLPQYRNTFEEFQKRFAAGELEKAVPIIADERSLEEPNRIKSHLSYEVLGADSTLYPYGWVTQSEALVGASPEILYHLSADGRAVQTVALAASRPSLFEAELLSDEKELREQRLVRDYLFKSLLPLGEVEESAPEILTLKNVSHIRQHIQCFARRRVSFIELQRTLHPTPALGVYPRSALQPRHLNLLSGELIRRRFGAPFGVVLPDGEALSIVAIRGAEIFRNLLRVSAGAGILKESVLEREWQELQLKLGSIRELLGLNGVEDFAVPQPEEWQ